MGPLNALQGRLPRQRAAPWAGAGTASRPADLRLPRHVVLAMASSEGCSCKAPWCYTPPPWSASAAWLHPPLLDRPPCCCG